MEHLKKLDKDGEITEDEHRSLSDKLQKLTDKVIGEIDQALAGKEAEITKV
jgi:ribosome recycling factor